ncbi:hypothetical protein KEM56_006739 [Ascosphaera pollenicola]|nr:hypothetical protein KEM56_006739 [Ascosphaera pollenicola]
MGMLIEERKKMLGLDKEHQDRASYAAVAAGGSKSETKTESDGGSDHGTQKERQSHAGNDTNGTWWQKMRRRCTLNLNDAVMLVFHPFEWWKQELRDMTRDLNTFHGVEGRTTKLQDAIQHEAFVRCASVQFVMQHLVLALALFSSLMLVVLLYWMIVVLSPAVSSIQKTLDQQYQT